MHLKTTVEGNHLCWFVSFIASEFVFGVCILICISNSFCIRNLCCTLHLKPLRKPSLNGCTGFLCGIPFDCSISPLFPQLTSLTINNMQLLSLQNSTLLLNLGPLAIIELVGRWCCLKAGVIEFSGFMASCWLSSDCLYQIFYDLMLARFNFNLKTDSTKN